jgi:hypothetical protein
MKLQAHVIMNLALGLSMGVGGAACQLDGKTSQDLAESKRVQQNTNQDIESEQSTETHPEPVAAPAAPVAAEPRRTSHRDPCPMCGMG